MRQFSRIRDLREDKDMTQQQFADFLHVTQKTYSRYETGEHSIPIETLIKISDFYGISVDYILELTDNPKRNY